MANNKVLFDQLWKEPSEFYANNDPTHALQLNLIECVMSVAQENKGVSSILDVGCGNGTKTAFLKSLFPNADVLGIDFSQTGVDYANTHYAKEGIRYDCVSAENNRVYGQKYDLIAAQEILEHLDEWQPVLKQICEASQKYVLITVPIGRLQKREFEICGHIRRL